MTRSFELDVGAETATGRVRDHNEDSYGIDEQLGLFLVADGMGGHNAGERASFLAVREIRRHLDAEHDGEDADEELRAAFHRANDTIYQESAQNPERRGMGTTMTALWVVGTRFRIGHVGDSRAWRIRDQACEQLTEDHSVVAHQLRAGLIDAEQAISHPLRNVLTRSLGNMPDVEVDVFGGDVRTGDVFVLGTDGMTEALDAAAIGKRVRGAASARAAAEEIVRHACATDGTDNVTTIVVACRERDPGS